MPQIHLIGNAHLDPAWMWRMEEGLAAFRATCRSALDRIREFPGFIFTCSSAAHFAFVEETDPDLFGRIQQAVCDGRWAIVGGWWVEPDCNLPSGESFIRQALLGQEYFQRRFGKIATVAYNIDSFGHNANLPQLLRKAGLTSYVFMRPGEEEKPLPASLFQWEAPSGDRVTAYRLPLHYSNYEFSTREKLHRLPDYPLYTPEPPWMIFFGVGNHGGGPTIAELEDIADLRKEQRGIELSEPERFFAAIDCTTLPVVHDEIQPHAIGCYSAHSEIKQLHRRTEHALLTAERAQVLGFLFEYLLGSQASLIMREDLRLDKTEDSPAFSRRGQGVVELDRAWKNLCFNQFHDLLGGVAIREACDDSISMYREAISVADRITRDKLGSLMARIDMSAHIENLVVFNLSAHPRKELIEFECWLPHESGQKPLPEVRLISPDGKAVPSQRIEASGKIGDDRMRYAAIVSVPAFGWSVFGIERSNSVSVTDVSEITLPVEYAPAVIVRDESDTWGHGATSFTDYESEFRIDAIETIEHGPLRTGCRIKSSGGASRMEEEILWTKDDPAIEIRVFLDWHERHRILKIRFRHGCADPVANYEIPYAWVQRPTGPREWPGQMWVCVTERDGSHGVAIVTDSKYSYSVDSEFIYIIAARSPLFAHHTPPHVMHEGERERYQDQGEQEFRLLLIPYEGNWSGSHIARFQSPLIVQTESGHNGQLPSTFAGFKRDSRAIHVGALKKAQDDNGIILRAVEQAGESSEATFEFPTLGARWRTSFSPFEIRTFLVRDGHATEVDFLERPL